MPIDRPRWRKLSVSVMQDVEVAALLDKEAVDEHAGAEDPAAYEEADRR